MPNHGFYQSGGAIGFRDQLQDSLGLKYLNTDMLKEQVLKHAKHQFLDGDVEHWWHDETSRGIRTRFSDDRLWLVYLVLQYIECTGDVQILDIQVPYISGNKLDENEDENYDVHVESKIQESVYMHCKRAIDISMSLGENNLPLIGSGDWNDGFSTVGNKGKGESIWLGFFLYDILSKFINIIKEKEDVNAVEKYIKFINNLKVSLNKRGWDGNWYRRAYTDNKEILGSNQSKECMIDSISQSWAIISKAADDDKKYIAMKAIEKYLIDKDEKVIKLLDPPFEKSSVNPGYIKAYLPGVRENGGQYTHSAIWVAIAFSILKEENKAHMYFNMINPIEHSNSKDKIDKYKIEPYVISADIYGNGNLLGRGGWSWYTGSASWYYVCGIEYILGLNIKKQTLSINPCIPNEWEEYFIQYRYGESIYNIKVKNMNKTNIVQKFLLNNQEIIEKQIKLVDNGRINEVEIIT